MDRIVKKFHSLYPEEYIYYFLYIKTLFTIYKLITIISFKLLLDGVASFNNMVWCYSSKTKLIMFYIKYIDFFS